MLRKFVIATAAAATLTAGGLAANTSQAQAGVHVHFGGFGGGYYNPYWGSPAYFGGGSYLKCKKKFIGYKVVWTKWGKKKKPMFKKKCWKVFH